MTAQAATLATLITIPAARLADAEKRVSKFVRKAKRLGMVAPSLEVTRTFDRLWVVRRNGEPGPAWDGALPLCYREDVRVDSLAMAEVEIRGERPIVAGWGFCATLEHTAAGNLLRCAPGLEGDLPAEYRTCGPEWCDHCGKRRRRNHTFVLRNIESGEFKRVGRSCLADFLGASDPAVWMATFEFVRELEALSAWDLGDGGYGSSAPTVRVADYLALTVAWIRKHGWIPASAAKGFGCVCTAGEVYHAISAKDAEDRRAALAMITDEDRDIAEGARAWIATDAAGSSDYIWNLRVAAALEGVDSRTSRLLASLIPCFRRDLAARKAAAAKTNEHIPGVAAGDKVDIELVCTGVYEHEFSWRVTFEDAQGRAVIWWASNPGDDFDTGDRVQVRGRVKKLDTWNGKRQTVLTRCKVARLDAMAGAA